MDIAFLIGRIIAGGYFIMGGFHHFQHLGMMTGYAKGKGTPAPAVAVAGTGILLLLGGLSLLLGYQPIVGIVLLIVFLLGVSFGMHNFWSVQDPQMKMFETVNFMKNMGILGLLLTLAAIPRPWPLSLGH